MAVDQQQLPNPLQLGQTLYEVLDASIIATPNKATAARYQRAVFTSTGGSAVESLDIAAQDQIRDVKADLDMTTGTRNVYVLTGDSLQVLGSDAGTATSKSLPLASDAAQRVVGLDPTWTDKPHVQLLGSDSQGIFLRSLDCTSGELAQPLRLSGAEGTPVDALLVRRQLDVHVVLCTVNSGQVTLYDLGPTVLGPNPTAPSSVSALTLGTSPSADVVSLTAASLSSLSTDQHVAVAFPGTDQALNVEVAGWDQSTLTTMASTTPDLSFAPPESEPHFRITAGDVIAGGTDQLVVGYTADYKESRGCAALLLFELDTPTNDSPSLKQLSQYAVANTDDEGNPIPLSTKDLHLAAGLFGEVLPSDRTDVSTETSQGVLGVLVTGAASTAGQLFRGEASLVGGLVPVDPNNKTFPSLGDKPGTLQNSAVLMTINAHATGFFCVPSDVTGNSVILGPPTLSQTSGKGQLLAVIQAPPFEAAVAETKPQLTFGESSQTITGCSVSSSKTWTFTDDTGGSIGVGPLALQRNVSNSYGSSFDKVEESSTSTLVHAMSQITLNDLMVLYSMEYDVWTYPVYRKARQSEPDGTMAVIFPTTPNPVQTITPASTADLGYIPQSQSGVLLSYVDVPREGYDQDRLLFDLNSVPVTDDSGSTVTYDQTVMTGKTTNKSFTVHNSTTDSEHFSYSTSLLSYIPLNFGLNLSQGQSYSKTDVHTTSLAHTTSLSISVSTGSVKDIGHAYQITPYIYYHKTMGCLMVSYDVTMDGKGWADYYKVPQVLLHPLEPNAADPVLSAFSRSLSFSSSTDGTVEVSAEIFNNGLSEVQNVVCEFYKGAPRKQGGKLTPTGPKLDTKTLATLSGAKRDTAVSNLDLEDNDQVTVKVYVTGLPTSEMVYWGIYPPSAYRDWKLQYDALTP